MTPAERIDAYLRKRRSPLAGLGATFVAAGRKHGVDANLLVAITGAESGFGKTRSGRYNPFGWGPGINFDSYPDAINAVASGLQRGYYSQGRKTIEAIGAKWAPIGASNDPTGLNNNWAKNVRALYGELGGGGLPVPTDPSQAVSAAPAASFSAPDLSQVALQNLSGQSGQGDATQGLRDLALSVAQQQGPTPTAGAPVAAPSPPSPVTAKAGNVIIAKGADRPGASTSAGILAFTHNVSAILGKPLTITTGTSHNQYVAGTRRQSAHWQGNAVDIAARGDALTAMGRAALVAAGMDPKKAAKVKGGLFNIGGYQVIFNTRQGGNHWDHLHVGLRG